MAEHGLVPDLVLCSSSVRTRATLTLVLSALENTPPPPVSIEDGLYLASAGALLARLRAVEPAHALVLVIGHNPGIHEIALELTGSGDRNDLALLSTGFPTAALAVLAFDVDRWDEVRAGAGRLQRLITPKQLD